MNPNTSTNAPSTEELYDLAIIGGGIAGAAIARDAALRGLKTVLFEKNDFGSGTSSKSSKLIHGGIRYLELSWNALRRSDIQEAWKNLSFVFSSLRESQILRRIAPDLIEPLPIVIPLYGHLKRKPLMVYLGAILYYGMALFSSGKARWPSLYFSKQALLKHYPELSPDHLKGGLVIWDHRADDHALVLATIRSAQKNGAVCLPHAAVIRYRHDTKQNSYCLTVEQKEGTFACHARKLINASGPWVDQVRSLGNEHDRDFILPVAGAHIETKLIVPYSMLLEAQDGRLFFVIALKDRSRIGTTERLIQNPEGVSCTEEEKKYLLDSLRRYFPNTPFKKEDILNCDAGVRPLAVSLNTHAPNEVSREHEFRVSPSGVIHVLGVKLTDHRRAAEEVVDRLIPTLLAHHPTLKRKSITHKTAL